ncbi:MAG: CPBP family intramembrane metalloprotease [Polyangiaceae bacterium]|nr:CPBP family intramembrane metalloprotease [Polyangiaceae bacterium]MCE7891830.1 CPBP family intramembrane metalloprotease [Sorangiineae bacterium PRO1]MCL4752963.1 CPBP family intramembrane metalloprotease [Myxococcales bacterium]
MAEPEKPAEQKAGFFAKASDAWSDLVLTLPIFVLYHLGVVFLPVRNAADVVTSELIALANNNMVAYAGLTLLIGGVFVGVLLVLGRGHALEWERFAFLAVEATLYAVAMRFIAGWVVGKLTLAGAPLGGGFTGAVMSAGAGLYEEIAFRVILYGLGLRVLLLMFPMVDPLRPRLLGVAWALIAAAVFSGWHYVGAYGDPFELRSFVFRWTCGVVFTVIYRFRGFAPAVWTHTLYDVWVLVL